MHTEPEQASPNIKEERTWTMLTHLLALSGMVIPFGNIIGPLFIWLIKKDALPLVDDQGRESLNFQITMTLAYAVCYVLILAIIGLFLLVPLVIYSVVMIIIAATKAHAGEAYRYPLTLRLID